MATNSCLILRSRCLKRKKILYEQLLYQHFFISVACLLHNEFWDQVSPVLNVIMCFAFQICRRGVVYILPQDVHGEEISNDAEEGDARHEEALDEVLEKRLLLILRRHRLLERSR